MELTKKNTWLPSYHAYVYLWINEYTLKIFRPSLRTIHDKENRARRRDEIVDGTTTSTAITN